MIIKVSLARYFKKVKLINGGFVVIDISYCKLIYLTKLKF